MNRCHIFTVDRKDNLFMDRQIIHIQCSKIQMPTSRRLDVMEITILIQCGIQPTSIIQDTRVPGLLTITWKATTQHTIIS